MNENFSLELENTIHQTQEHFNEKRRWLIWSVATSFLLFQFLLQLSTGVMYHDLLSAFSTTAFGIGIIAGAFYYVYILFQIPAGILIDHFGPRKLTTVGAFIFSIGCFLFSISHFFWLAVFGRLLMGGGSACAFISCVRLISIWFSPRRFAFLLGLTEGLTMLGTVIGNILLGFLIHSIGWRSYLFVSSLIGLSIAFCCYRYILDEPDPLMGKKDRPPLRFHHVWQDLLPIIKQPIQWFNGIYTGILFSLATVFASVYGIPFIESAYHLEVGPATVVNMLLYVGIAMGCPLYGWLDSLLKKRRYLFIFGGITSTILTSVMIYNTSFSLWFLGLLFFILGIVCSSYLLSFTVAHDITPSENKGLAIGFANTFGMLTAPIFQAIIGYVMSASAKTHLVNGVLNYQTIDYQRGFMLLPIVFFLSIVIGFFIPDRHV